MVESACPVDHHVRAFVVQLDCPSDWSARIGLHPAQQLSARDTATLQHDHVGFSVSMQATDSTTRSFLHLRAPCISLLLYNLLPLCYNISYHETTPLMVAGLCRAGTSAYKESIGLRVCLLVRLCSISDITSRDLRYFIATQSQPKLLLPKHRVVLYLWTWIATSKVANQHTQAMPGFWSWCRTCTMWLSAGTSSAWVQLWGWPRSAVFPCLIYTFSQTYLWSHQMQPPWLNHVRHEHACKALSLCAILERRPSSYTARSDLCRPLLCKLAPLLKGPATPFCCLALARGQLVCS